MPWGVSEDKPPVNSTVKKWAALVNATDSPDILDIKNGIYSVRYGTSSGVTVEYYLIDGMGHTWPGGKSLLPQTMVGPVSNKISATDVMWEFFSK